jgi:hypothetical protein
MTISIEYFRNDIERLCEPEDIFDVTRCVSDWLNDQTWDLSFVRENGLDKYENLFTKIQTTVRHINVGESERRRKDNLEAMAEHGYLVVSKIAAQFYASGKAGSL